MSDEVSADAVETPTPTEETTVHNRASPWPPGTPWWAVFAFLLLTGGFASGIGFGIVTADDVAAELHAHEKIDGHPIMLKNYEQIQDDLAELRQAAEFVRQNRTNILLLCQAQEVECVTTAP